MSKKLVVWALALSVGFAGLSSSVFADDAKKKETSKTEVKAEAKTEPKAEESCHKKVKKSKSCHRKAKKGEKVEEIPTEPSPDAKTPERK